MERGVVRTALRGWAMVETMRLDEIDGGDALNHRRS
jgi:hypothetical protein